MDSGKSSLVQETLFENDFADGKGVIIMCEDGDVEYDLDKLAEINFSLVTIEKEEDFTDARLAEINEEYKPEQVFIEYNGTWEVANFLEANLPKGWVLVQSLATVDSTTFENYWNNMRAMMQEQVFEADVVVFNRTDDDTDRAKFRRLIKTVNRKAQIVYERKDGTIDERPEELPFDIDQDIIELSDSDYGIWYMDAVDNYKKYHGKKVKFLALVYNPDKLKSGAVEPEGPPGFIFPNDFVILDEAHTIENVAANQLGLSLSEAEMKYELLRLYNPHTHKGSMRHNASPTLLQLIEEAQAAVGEFFTAARADCQLDAHHGTVRLRQPEWTENLLSPVLRQLFAELKDMAAMEENDLTKAELLDTAARILAYDEAATEMVKLTNAASTVYWVESHGLEGQFTTMRGALINVAPVLREKLFESGRSCICTSATLSTGERGMEYFAGRVGAESARPLQIGSPFDFEKQMRIIVARSMPPPPPASEEDEYHPALAEWIMRSLDESQGRAFVLFTSYNLMRAMAVRLRPFCQERGWPLLVQGDELSRSQMVHSFRENIGSVLLGTDSFWTGVDVPGEALSNVIVTKIPFESPGNPLVEARIEDITARGGNAFRDYSLPEAVLKFRQGIGRLIRSRTDTGIVTILDSRVTSKFYGARFMYALPPTAPREFL